MAIFSLTDAQLAFGHVSLLDHAHFSLEEHERVGLIGRNGAGKSSLLKVIAHQILLDDGLLTKQKNIRTAFVAQEANIDPALTVFDAVAKGLGNITDLLKEYDFISAQLQMSDASDGLDQLHAIQEQLERLNGWGMKNKIDTILDKLHLSGETSVGTLSGGGKKRLALAAALVSDPDVLLLDEPTNHLDYASILWLIDLLCRFKGSMVFITHDRFFLDQVATRIIELDRGRIDSFPGRFSAYEKRKADDLANEVVASLKFDKFLAQEEVWIRKGVEARRTRNEGRVKRLEMLREERSKRRDAPGVVTLDVALAKVSGKVVVELDQVMKAYDEKIIINNLSVTICRGDKVGIVGNNGVGKTTLLKLILGKTLPDKGRVKLGSQVKIVYFDQMREALNEEATLIETISPGSEWLVINEQKKHVMRYLGDFLFSPERAYSPVKSLSGGERNRLLLARLFSQPSNVLVLDEPTNDLDIVTLELLEDLLVNYTGTTLLVSHDRTFLENVTTQMIVSDEPGVWREYVGGTYDWGRLADNYQAVPKEMLQAKSEATSFKKKVDSPTRTKNLKLSFKEERELADIPEKIMALEEEQKQLGAQLEDPDTYKTKGENVAQLTERYHAIENLLVNLLARWEELENRHQGG